MMNIILDKFQMEVLILTKNIGNGFVMIQEIMEENFKMKDMLLMINGIWDMLSLLY